MKNIKAAIFALEKECTDGETAVCNLASINLSRINTKEDIEKSYANCYKYVR